MASQGCVARSCAFGGPNRGSPAWGAAVKGAHAKTATESQAPPRPERIALRIALIYVTVGFLWIYFSDQLVAAIELPFDTRLDLQTYKGWAFVAMSGALIYALVRGYMGAAMHLAERRAALARTLRKDRTLMRSVFRSIREGIAVVDQDGALRFANRAARGMLGEDTASLNDVEFVRVDDNTRCETHALPVYQALRGESAEEIEVFVTAPEPGAAQRRAVLGAAPLVDEAGGVEGAVLTLRDISRRRAAEQTLAAREAQFRRLLEDALDIIAEIDEDGRVIYATPSLEHVLGFTGAEVREEHIVELLVHPADQERTRATLAAALAEPGAVVRQEFRCRHKAGGWRYLEGSGKAAQRAGGGKVFVLNARDVTERKAHEAEIRRLLLAMEQSSEAVAVVDAAGVAIFANPAFESLIGCERGAAECRELRALCLEAQLVCPGLWDALASAQAWSGRVAGKRAGAETFEADVTVSPVFEDDGALANHILVARDITLQQRLETQIRRTEKLEAIGALAGGIAHDFNNILGAMMGYTDMALQEAPAEGPLREHLTETLRAGRRARELTAQILTFSRQSESVRKPIRMDAMCQEVARLIRAAVPANIEISLKLDDGGRYVEADATQMHQVLMNLCTNAYHAMADGGGKLTVSSRLISLDRRAARAFADIEAGHYVRISVRDSGVGMDRATLDRVFEPFFTTKKEGEGTGLGLPNVHGIVRAHGGTVTAYSESGRGSVFRVYLPAAAGPAEEGEAESKEGLDGGSEHILLVDDEEMLIRVGSMMLQRLGYKVTSCNSGEAALELLTGNPGAFDLVITDQSMTGITGLELARAVKGLRPELPVMLSTGFSDAVSPDGGLPPELCGMVMKPVILSELASAVRRALAPAE